MKKKVASSLRKQAEIKTIGKAKVFTRKLYRYLKKQFKLKSLDEQLKIKQSLKRKRA